MMSYDPHEACVEGLKRLQFLAPDPGHANRVRVRCRTQLGRNQRHVEYMDVMSRFARRVLAPVVVVSFCALYIAALVTTTLRLHGFFH